MKRINKITDAQTTSLHRISQLPLDTDAEIFRQYPAFKLGVTTAIRHYAQLLLPLVKRLINTSEHNGWILTAPAITGQTPAAANLLCWELVDLYMRERDVSNSKELSLINLQYDSAITTSQDYSKLNFAERSTQREQLSRRLVHNAAFRGRPVLFVNDIRVTGAQQDTMQQYFERAEAVCVKWLYVIVVDPAVGRANPELEWQLNFAPFEDLLRLVSRERIQFTGKCVHRLMHLSIAELEQVLRALNGERRKRLLELAVLNGFQNTQGFEEQMELLRSHATQHTTQTSVYPLRTIEKLPIDFSDEFFRHYPRVKLGVTESVDYFGSQLSRVTEDIITQSLPESTDWVITGQAYNVLPGAPNLLCSYIHADLKKKLPDSIKLSLVNLREPTDDLEIKDSESLNKYHNYATFKQQQRTEVYAELPEPLFDPRDFRGRSILFVNDIKVTGTHQRYMQQVLDKLNPRQICWLYILEIDKEIAEAEPEVEYAINHSSVAGFEEFADLLATHNVEYTSRCITRLLSYDLSQLEELFAMLDVGRKRKILEVAIAEGRFSGELFKDKIDLLKRSAG